MRRMTLKHGRVSVCLAKGCDALTRFPDVWGGGGGGQIFYPPKSHTHNNTLHAIIDLFLSQMGEGRARSGKRANRA